MAELVKPREPGPSTGLSFESRRVVTPKRVAIAAVALVAAWLVLVTGVYLTHPRSEADFLAQASIEGGDEIEAIVAEHGPDALVREGDRACTWMGDQEKAWWNHGAWFSREGVVQRYVEQMRPAVAGIWGPPAAWDTNRAVVASAAFDQLCGGTWWMHRSHGPSLSSGGPEGGGGGGGD